MNRKQGFFRILAGVLLAVLLLVPGSRAVSASGGATGAKPAQGNLQMEAGRVPPSQGP